MSYFFTSDEHYGHAAIIKHCNRPFENVEEMNAEIIRRHNEIVGVNDITVHAGDFCWVRNIAGATEYIKKLKGNHIFIKGSHDKWLPASAKYMWRKMIEGQLVVACHYAMRTWERACHGSWQVYGHSHGQLLPVGSQYDVGVDCNNFYPVSFDLLRTIIMENNNES